MTQHEKRLRLIRYLTDESREYKNIEIPSSEGDCRVLLRALLNVRPPAPVSEEFSQIEGSYLREETRLKGIVSPDELKEVQSGIYLWQGDITRLKAGAIVNAANSGMTGCYRPNHTCIDNCIHTFAGTALRLYCAEMMKKQGFEEPAGMAKITPAFNLPCDFVIHTVGPIVQGRLTKKHEQTLASCYRSCLRIADENSVPSIAFCCISTGVFGFPQKRAAEIAAGTVKDYIKESGSKIKVIFNVFTDTDLEIYREILG